MDALEFIKTAQRYTKEKGCDIFAIAKLEPPEEILNRMEQWAAEHPIKTRQSKLLEIFPNAINKELEEYVDICPYFIEPDLFGGLDCTSRFCPKCKKDFWLEEVDIGKMPAADVEPVRHGRWELYGNDDDISASYFCSLCGWNIDEDEYLDHFSHFRYCPNCGAKMDGGAD